VIAAGDIVANKKPAPDIYNYVLEKLDLPTENCLVIEDSEQGLKAATNAGLKTVITINNYTQNDNFEAAFLVLNSLENITLEFLKNLINQ
jgi:beta-phosphoglucomutase-like phosphatase (HAD superfamily)